MSTLIRIRPSCTAFTADAIVRRCGYVMPHFTFECERTHGVSAPRRVHARQIGQAKPSIDALRNVLQRWLSIDSWEDDEIAPQDLVLATRQQFERLSLQHPVQTFSPAKDQGQVAP